MSLSTNSTFDQLKAHKASYSISVTSLEVKGNLKLSSEGLDYISSSCCSYNDPYLVLHWIKDGVMDALLGAAGNQIQNLP